MYATIKIKDDNPEAINYNIAFPKVAFQVFITDFAGNLVRRNIFVHNIIGMANNNFTADSCYINENGNNKYNTQYDDNIYVFAIGL